MFTGKKRRIQKRAGRTGKIPARPATGVSAGKDKKAFAIQNIHDFTIQPQFIGFF
jgi:hypothetical protein